MSPPSPEAARHRRLIPDLSGQVEQGGQTLVRVKRASEPASPELTLDAVAKKHLGHDAEQVLAENADVLRGVSGANLPLDPPADLARRVDFYAPDPAAPPAEIDPQKRELPTLGSIVGVAEGVDFLTDKEPPRTLFDLFALFPQLDGDNWFVHIVRKTPKSCDGLKCDGALRRLTRAISLEEWQDEYGGGDFELTVYGPPKKGIAVGADGRFAPKALTAPIMMTFPGAPSFYSLVHGDLQEEEDMLHPSMAARRHIPQTNADASVARAQIDADLTREERQDARSQREKDEAKTRERERLQEQTGIAQQITDLARQLAEQQADFRREALEENRAHQAELQKQRDGFEERLATLAARKPEKSDLETALAISKNLVGDGQASAGAMEALRSEHAREIDRLQRQISDDRARADTRLGDERERCDRLIEDEKRRAQERVGEVERRAREHEETCRTRAEQEVRAVKEDAERRLAEMHRQTETRIADLDRSHQRDLANKESTHALALKTVETTLDMRLENTKTQVKRAEADAERYRLEAEGNKDFVGRLEQFKEQAATIGLVDASEANTPEPESVGQSMIKMGLSLAQGFPAMLENILSSRRTPADLEAARQAERQTMIGQAEPPQLQSGHRPRRQLPEGSLRHMSEVPPPVRRPGQSPTEPLPSAAGQTFAPMASVPAPEGPPLVEVAPMVVYPAAAPPPAPPTQLPPSQPPPAPEQDLALALEEDRKMLEGAPILLHQMQMGATAADLARDVFNRAGPDTVQSLLRDFQSPERVILAVERSGDPASPFLRREGKRFLRELFSELRKTLG